MIQTQTFKLLFKWQSRQKENLKRKNIGQDSYFFTLPHLLLCPIKVIIDVYTSQKLSNGIFERVLLLLNNLYKIFKLRSSSLVDNKGSCQVT